jgi:integrase
VSIQKLPTGRYKARYRTPGDKRHLSRTFDLKRDAETWLANQTTDLAAGTWLDPERGKMLMADFAKQWQAGRVDVRASTKARDEYYLKTLVKPTFGALPLASIGHAQVQAWIADLTRTYAPGTVVKARQLLGALMKAAVLDRRIPVNPVEGTKAPRDETDAMRCLTVAEVNLLVEKIDQRYRAFVLIGGYCGLRLGEMLALDWSNVDLAAKKIRVERTLVEVRGALLFHPTKTKAGKRTVPMPMVVVEELVKIRKPDGLVFTGSRGAPLRPANFRKRTWSSAVEAAGIGATRIHDLRHTAVSWWLSVGATAREVADRAGHASVVTVLDRYAHAIPEAEDTVTAALDALARDRS